MPALSLIFQASVSGVMKELVRSDNYINKFTIRWFPGSCKVVKNDPPRSLYQLNKYSYSEEEGCSVTNKKVDHLIWEQSIQDFRATMRDFSRSYINLVIEVRADGPGLCGGSVAGKGLSRVHVEIFCSAADVYSGFRMFVTQ